MGALSTLTVSRCAALEWLERHPPVLYTNVQLSDVLERLLAGSTLHNFTVTDAGAEVGDEELEWAALPPNEEG